MNCPQHIPEKFGLADVRNATAVLRDRNAALKAENAALRAAPAVPLESGFSAIVACARAS